MDASKSGKGILASLEHKTAEPPRRFATPTAAAARGPALAVAGGILASALLAWWLYSGPSPVMIQDALPPAPGFTQAAPAPEPSAGNEAAAIVDETPAAPAPSPALAAVLAPTPIAAVVMHRERAAARPHAKPKPKPVVARREPPRRPALPAPDSDVALLSALVAHANDDDVVEIRAGDSTESLLQRCRRVGGEEGRLCGVRICASRARDRACHAE